MSNQYLSRFLGHYVLVSTGNPKESPQSTAGSRSAAPAFFGYLMDHHDGWCMLADSALWTNGMTKDLHRPGKQMIDADRLPWRLGMTAVCPSSIAVTGHPGETGTGLYMPLDTALGMVTSDMMQNVTNAYLRPRPTGGSPPSNDPSLNIDGVLAVVQPEWLPGLPRRVAASVILHAAGVV